MIGQLVVNGLVFGALVALMAVGFSLIFGILRIVNFWHGEAYMMGAVAVFFFVVKAGVPFGAAVVIAVVIVGGIGWIADRLGTFTFTNPTLMLARVRELGLDEELGERPADTPVTRADHIRVLCPRCRRESLIATER